MSSLLQAVAIMAAGKFLFAIQDVIIKEMSSWLPGAPDHDDQRVWLRYPCY